MSFDPNIPQPQSLRPPDFVQIQDNFQTFYDVFNAEHGSLDDATSSIRGKHLVPKFPPLTADPSTGAAKGALYTYRNTDDVLEVRFRQESDGDVILLAQGNFPTVNGVTYLASGIFDSALTITKSNNIDSITSEVSSGTATYTIVFSTALPTVNYMFQIDTSFTAYSAPYINSINKLTTQVSFNCSTSYTDFTFMIWSVTT